MFKLTWGITHDGNSKTIMRIPQLYVKGKGKERKERRETRMMGKRDVCLYVTLQEL